MRIVPFVFIALFITTFFVPPEIAKADEVGVININTASAKVLAQLPGVGPLTAAAIIERRRKRPFTSIIHVRRVPGIGVRKYRRLRSLITVSGPTTFQSNAHPEASPCGAPRS